MIVRKWVHLAWLLLSALILHAATCGKISAWGLHTLGPRWRGSPPDIIWSLHDPSHMHATVKDIRTVSLMPRHGVASQTYFLSIYTIRQRLILQPSMAAHHGLSYSRSPPTSSFMLASVLLFYFYRLQAYQIHFYPSIGFWCWNKFLMQHICKKNTHTLVCSVILWKEIVIWLQKMYEDVWYQST